MAKTRFYLIRHGETAWNKEGKYQGWTDIELSKTGVMQAKLLGERFCHIPVDMVYSSPLKRAVETARPVAKAAGVPIITDEHFKEINFGSWEGGTVAELTKKYGKAFSDFFADPFKYDFPGEGSFSLVMKRSLEGFQEILKHHEGKNIAIVSHGGLLRVLMIAIMDVDTSFYRKTWLHNTSITTIDIIDKTPLLLTLNDKAHIENMND